MHTRLTKLINTPTKGVHHLIRSRINARNSTGLTLVELLIVIAVNSIAVVPLLAWAVVSMNQQVRSEQQNIETRSLGLANTYFPRDVRNATLAAVDSQLSGGVVLPDCTGDLDGGGAPGTVKTVLLTAGNRLIVYKITDAPADSDYSGQVMWRRECNNNSSAPAPPAGSGLPPGIGGTTVLTERVVSEEIKSIAAVCPSPTAGTGGSTTDKNCWSVKLTAKLVGVDQQAVLQASRRINAYTAPGSPPIARITYFPAAVSTCTGLNVSGSHSSDPFSEGISTYAWKLLKVIDDGTGSHTELQLSHSDTSPTWSVPPSSLTEKGQYQVELTITAGSPGSPQGERTGFTVTSVSVGDCVPLAEITHLRGVVWPTGEIPRVNRGETFTVKGLLTSADATGPAALSYTWEWGEDAADGSPKQTATAAVASCADPVHGPCEVNASFAGYETLGVKRITLSMTDSQGRTTTTQRAIYVVSNIYYASAASTDDSGTCGPISSPCKSLVQAAANAKTNGKTVIRVAAGPKNSTGTVYEYKQGPVLLTGISGMTIDGGWVQDTTTGAFEERSGSDSRRPFISDASTQSAANRTGNAIIIDSSTVTLKNLSVLGTDAPAVTAGDMVPKSSYGVRVINSSSVVIESSKLMASNGANAADVNTTAPAAPATTGNGGQGQNSGGNGGSGGATSGANSGGSGGIGGGFYAAGGAGNNGSGTNGGAGGSGGCGSAFGCGTDPKGGKGGQSGSAGVGGNPANLTPVSGPTWQITRGFAGADGGIGGGGGGGGGGKSASAYGGGGGGGGAGGKGGIKGAEGGYSGGGSFGLYVHNSTVTVKNSEIRSASGANGAKGQPGGRGGAGGNGGNGGNKSCCEASGGAGGGGGGAGGGGGGAGSGNGGPSISAFFIGTAGGLTFQGSNTLVNDGNAGNGGATGAVSAKGTGGTGGGQGNCPLIGSCGDADGKDGATGAAGNGGLAGATGLKFKSWINGATT